MRCFTYFFQAGISFKNNFWICWFYIAVWSPSSLNPLRTSQQPSVTPTSAVYPTATAEERISQVTDWILFIPSEMRTKNNKQRNKKVLRKLTNKVFNPYLHRCSEPLWNDKYFQAVCDQSTRRSWCCWLSTTPLTTWIKSCTATCLKRVDSTPTVVPLLLRFTFHTNGPTTARFRTCMPTGTKSPLTPSRKWPAGSRQRTFAPPEHIQRHLTRSSAMYVNQWLMLLNFPMMERLVS